MIYDSCVSEGISPSGKNQVAPLEPGHMKGWCPMVEKTDRDRLQAEVHMHWLWGGEGGIVEMTASGKRDPTEVAMVLQAIKDGKKFRSNSDVSVSAPTGADVNSQLASWQNLYLELGLKVDVTNLKIPVPQPGFTRLILVPEGMTPNKAFALLEKKMQAWKYPDNLDTITSIRDIKKTYVIWVRDRQEADKELKNQSADDLKRDGVNCITLIERFLYELKFFVETPHRDGVNCITLIERFLYEMFFGKTLHGGQADNHLDVKNWTLCSGSRTPDGGVPYVGWDPDCGKVIVGWSYAGSRNDNLRSRAVVS